MDLTKEQGSVSAYKIAWSAALIFYFLEYLVRAAPAVMLPELSRALNIDMVGVSGVVGSYYYTYALASLAAGVCLDRFGAKAPVAAGCGLLAIGCLLFVVPVPAVAELGRLIQGFGSAFAFTGAVFLAAHGFSGGVLATAIGVTQCLGMLGGSAGQLAVGPLLREGIGLSGFWIAVAIACLATATLLGLATPREELPGSQGKGLADMVAPFKTVFANPQSYLCGLTAGLLFVPTTVGGMIWGVAFYQQDRGFAHEQAVTAAAMVPLGWAIGCPLFGALADKLGRRKLALMIGQAVMLVAILLVGATPAPTPDYALMLVVGIGSGAAMIPYSIIKEVNPDRVKGSATGVMNFLTFSVTAIIGPIFSRLLGGSLASNLDHAAHFREAAWFWAAIVALSMGVTLALRETGQASFAHIEPKAP
ncbi:MAG TPA: MFS transporter [Magnetospirillaceae bacterium]|nr:MFS transporter [Magnetospirillaceae bacterium]